MLHCLALQNDVTCGATKLEAGPGNSTKTRLKNTTVKDCSVIINNVKTIMVSQSHFLNCNYLVTIRGSQAVSTVGLPYGLAVRIPGFHPGGPGSTPGMGRCFAI